MFNTEKQQLEYLLGLGDRLCLLMNVSSIGEIIFMAHKWKDALKYYSSKDSDFSVAEQALLGNDEV